MDLEWKKTIDEAVKKNEIMVFMRGTADQPRCGFSAKVMRVLKELNVPYGTLDMDSDRALWDTLKEINNWPTSPQIYIKGEFIGGCDIFVEMFRSGELQTMLGMK